MKLKFEVTSLRLALCRFEPDSQVPAWAIRGSFSSVTRTAEELSILCEAGLVPASVPSENDWACLKIAGLIPLTQTGVLAAFIAPLSERGIAIFTISTFDTDYVLVRESSLDTALAALKASGHEITNR